MPEDAGLPPGTEHQPRPWWAHAVSLAVCVAIFAAAYLGAAALFSAARMHADWYPIDNSRVATNVLAGFVQVGIAFVVAALFYKPASSWIRAKVHQHLHIALHHHRQLLATDRRAELAEVNEKHDALLTLTRHLILQHPAIDNQVPGLDPKYQPEAAAIGKDPT